MNCDVQSLVTAARDYARLSQRSIRQASVFLLCGIQNGGGLGSNLIPTSAQYNGGPPTYTLAVLKNTSYLIIWGNNDLSMTMGPDTYASTGAGTETIVWTGGNTSMVFTGTFAGTSVTAMVKIAPAAAIPIPSGFNLAIDASGTTMTATWNTVPGNVNSTEVWTSSDGVTYVLSSTVASPGLVKTGIAAPAVGSFLYVKIRWVNTTTQGGFVTPHEISGRAADWVKRVQTNGGAAPGATTRDAINTFDLALVAAGLDSKMLSLIPLVSDNLTASITPLYKVAGGDPWTNHSLVAGDLNANGLVGDAATKYLDSAFNCNTSWVSGNNSLFVYVSAVGGTPGHLFCTTGAASTNDGLYVDGTPGVSTGYNSQTVATSGTQFGAGFYVGSRTTANRMDLYYAKSSTAWSSIGNSVSGAGAFSSHNLYLLARDSSDTPASFSNSRVSLAGMASGLSSANGQALFNAVQAFRTALGGGFV